MSARQRSNTEVRVSGPRWFNNTPGTLIGGGSITTGVKTCDDIVAPGDCAPLTVEGRSTDGGYINRQSTGTNTASFDQYICDWFRTLNSDGGHGSPSGVPTAIAMATAAAARTNPSRPYVDVPAAVFDMRGGIQRIKNAGDDLVAIIRQTGSQYINYQFMIAPVVGDLVRAGVAYHQVCRRRDEINKLHDENGIRRTVSNGSYSTSGSYNTAVQSAGLLIQKNIRWMTTVECRTHVRWKPTSRSGIRPSPAQIDTWARRAVYGLTVDFSTLWEITPWSWLADWFGDVGTYLRATRNIIPATLSGVHPMKHWRTESVFDGGPINQGTISGGKVIRETKTRVSSFVAPTAHLPIFDERQLSILAALGASRR